MLDASPRLVAGLVLLALAVLAFVYRARLNKPAGRAVEAPTDGGRNRSLTVYRPDPTDDLSTGGMVDLRGTVVSGATITAPVSGQPCALWEVSLAEISPASPADDLIERTTTIWATARSADLVVEYDVRRDIGGDPRTGGSSQALGGPGRVSVPGDKVTIAMPDDWSIGEPMPSLTAFGGHRYRPADPAHLEGIGVPADLLARVRANPRLFEVAEAVVGSGGRIRLFQRPARAHGGPDPDGVFHVYPFDAVTVGAGFLRGCLSSWLGIVGAIAAVLGLLLVAAGSVDLAGS